MKYLAILLLVCVTACSSSGGSSGHPSASPTAQPTNTIAFPLFAGSAVLSDRSFRETVTAAGARSSGLAEGAGTYDGREVVAGTQAVMPALAAWIAQLDANPPTGYSDALSGSGIAAIRDHTRAFGLDFGVFEGTIGGKRHGVVVLAVDPQRLDRRAGPLLRAVGKYRLLPKMLRDPLDAQAKKELGFTVSQLTEPNTPLGAAVQSLDELRAYGGRGVVLIDAVKE